MAGPVGSAVPKRLAVAAASLWRKVFCHRQATTTTSTTTTTISTRITLFLARSTPVAMDLPATNADAFRVS
eukprot:9414493-Lingulodinium_polyedra.AAC.1